MQRSAIIELGAVSVETKGGPGDHTDDILKRDVPGLSRD
ncbi:benenodin family lasso peptide [Sphingomonas koreensis]|nr:benenodin family lasso peptide [Sphingomonas koreensis]